MTQAKITAATYNVHGWVGRDGLRRPARIIQIIRGLEADVIALQEASFSNDGPRGCAIDDLGRQTRMIAIPGITLIKKDNDFGNVLLTRHPVIELRKLDLTIKAREPRGAIIATLNIHGHPCTVIATHLGLQRRERRRQIQSIIRETALQKAGPIILMGDFNEWNALSGALRILKSRFGRLPAPFTYPSRFPVFALDRVLVNPNKALEEIRAIRSPLARLASDHLPVRATIRLS